MTLHSYPLLASAFSVELSLRSERLKLAQGIEYIGTSAFERVNYSDGRRCLFPSDSGCSRFWGLEISARLHDLC